MAKSYKFTGVSSSNYIQQINAESTVFDVAVNKGIKFFDGNSDETGAVWNGTQAIEITIPTLTDLVQDPIKFAGTVDANGDAKTAGGKTFTPTKGDLVYITENCTFVGQVCEAGDMAVYDGAAWRIIQGENQVAILGTADGTGLVSASIGTSAVSVLSVEGRTLGLTLNYDDLRGKIGTPKNDELVYNVTDGKVTVSSKYLALSRTSEDTTDDISTAVSINLPTALANGAVTISDKVLAAGDFTFTSGSFPTISKNAAAISVNVSSNISIVKNGEDGPTGDYITSVDAIKGVSFANGSAGSADISYMVGLNADTTNAKSFVSGIHAYTADDNGKTADLVIPGAVSVVSANNTFFSGIGDAAAQGDFVSSITVGLVTISTGSGILTGTTSGSTSFVSSVTIGSVVEDTTAQWFFSGLGEAAASGDVVSSVSVGAVSLISDNASAFAENAVISASVSGHVLSFNVGSFMKPVALSKTADTVQYKSFSKTGVKLSGFDVKNDTFTTGALNQATSEISYKSLLSKAVELTQGAATEYFFDKDQEHAYEASMDYKIISTTSATFTKNTPKLEVNSLTASIPANTVAVDLNEGTLPSLAIAAATGTISGTVGTELTTSDVSWLGVNEAKKTVVTAAGTYALAAVASDAAGAVEVGKEGEVSVTGAKVTVAASTFVTDVTVDGTSVNA